MYGKMKDFLANELAEIKAAGLYKNERIITTSQKADIKVNAGEEVINFCANNYLGLSDNPRLIQAAKDAMDSHGFGMSSVRFIAEHRIYTNSWKLRQVFPNRRHHPLCGLFRCQRRCFRTIVRRRRCYHFRFAEPRFYHRRGSSLQG